MAEYIDRELLKKAFPKAEANMFENCRYCTCLDSGQIEYIIDSIPAADVRPVVHGEWVINDECNSLLKMVCSLCGNVVAFISHPDSRWEFGNFCPNCGADMREPPKEET